MPQRIYAFFAKSGARFSMKALTASACSGER
jgi:hypothetical protein